MLIKHRGNFRCERLGVDSIDVDEEHKPSDSDVNIVETDDDADAGIFRIANDCSRDYEATLDEEEDITISVLRTTRIEQIKAESIMLFGWI